MTDHTAVRVINWTCHLTTLALAGFAVLIVTGSLVGNMNIISFMAILLFALVLLMFAGGVELVAYGVRQKWGEADA